MKSTLPLEKPIALPLHKIADWQLAPDPSASFQVDLPKLQRGFVWEPAKIINLWDSLLRGFPIGSLLLSEIGEKSAIETKDDAEFKIGKHWLLDGQQRATSIAMGFYNPWHAGAQTEDSLNEKPWSLKVIPTLWMDLLPNAEDDTKRFFPLLVTQSHPWGYKHDGSVLSWGERGKALGSFKAAIGHDNYTSYALTDVYPWQAQLPVPMAFLLDCGSSSQTDAQFLAALAELCRVLPKIWQNRFTERLAQVPLAKVAGFREATKAIWDYQIYLNYLKRSAEINDTITSDDNSILFVRLNTGGIPLVGEELIFSLFKSAFPAAKDAVEKAAVGFMAPSRLFTLFVRLVSAGGDAAKLHEPVSLGKFKKNIATDDEFKERLATFIRNDVAPLVAKAKQLLIGGHQFRLPPALATRTINDAPDVFLALMYWLKIGGTVVEGSVHHRAVLGFFTALSWFGGNAKQKRENLQQWMGALSEQQIEAFWSPIAFLSLLRREEDAFPTFPDPDDLHDFLNNGIVENSDYHWDKLHETLPNHKIWESYAHIPEFCETLHDGSVIKRRDQVIHANLIRFIEILSGSKHLLLFAQRDFMNESFTEFGQWEFALQDSNCPWDWDHIYPSAHGKWYVEAKYKDWHHTIGNLRAEKLSENRGNRDDLPQIKLNDDKVRKNSFISAPVWTMIQHANFDYKKEGSALLCRIILTRMVEVYREWYSTYGIKAIQAV